MKTVIEMALEAGGGEMYSSVTHPNGPTTSIRFPISNGSLEHFAELVRADERNRLADKLTQDFKGAFGADTCASWAVWLRGQK